MMSLTHGQFTQVSDSGPHGPLVEQIIAASWVSEIFCALKYEQSA